MQGFEASTAVELDLAAAALMVLMSVASAAASDVPIALWNRRRIIAELETRVDAKLDKLRDDLKPGVMRGDVDPLALNDRKAAKKAERTRIEVAIMTHLGQRFGPIKSKLVWDWLDPELREKVIAAGQRYEYVLEPLIAKLPPTLHVDNDATKEPAVPMQTHQ